MMCRNTNAPRRAALEALQDLQTGFAGSADAVSVYDDTTAQSSDSSTKATLVTLLLVMFEVSPALAIILSYTIAWVWPGWREA
jgi:hypothetical protein